MGRQSTCGKLTPIEVKQAERKSKPYKLSDGAGMYLEVRPSGSRYWRMKYRFNGKEKLYSIGVYPRMSLADARLSVAEARACLANDIDPTKKSTKTNLITQLTPLKILPPNGIKKRQLTGVLAMLTRF